MNAYRLLFAFLAAPSLMSMEIENTSKLRRTKAIDDVSSLGKVKKITKANMHEVDPESLQSIKLSKSLIKDFVKEGGVFTKEDEEVLTAALDKIKKRGNGDFDALQRGIIRSYLSDNLANSSEALLHSQDPNQILLLQMKNEHAERMQQTKYEYELTMQEKKSTQRKFYVTTGVALVTTIISVIEAYFLGVR